MDNNSELKDKKIICKDCQKEFLFTANDQKFYTEHNFEEPKRCKSCREARKQIFKKEA